MKKRGSTEKSDKETNRNYLVKFLLDQEADINHGSAKGLTPLMYAIQGKKMENVKLLLENGADVAKADKEGSTFLVILLS